MNNGIVIGISVVSSLIILTLLGTTLYFALFKKHTCPPPPPCPPCICPTIPPPSPSPPIIPSPTPTPSPSNNNTPTSKGSCIPSDGVWTRDGKLTSPCCQPPNYDILDPSYTTCDTYFTETDPVINKCMAECCAHSDDYVKNARRTGNLDPSFAPMSRCGCSLCCYNQKDPHFNKWGSCSLYITGEPAIASTPDTPPVGNGDWRGFVGFQDLYNVYN